MESEFIHWLCEHLPDSPSLRLGLGDDAAVLSLREGAGCVVTSDMLNDGVHFNLAECGPGRTGRKSLAVNLSDLAAMAARPVAAFVSLALPRDNGGLQLAIDLYEGLLPLAEQFGVMVAGGDTNSWNGPLVVSITAIGEETGNGLWKRGDAQVGDQILVTGTFGGSILGKHLDFTPRVSEALTLASRYSIHAATDVSDGLSLDLSHILEESNCGARLELDRIPVSRAASQLAQTAGDYQTAIEHALSDGEDFELILTVPTNQAERMLTEQPLDVQITRIGEIVETRGLWTVSPAGQLEPLSPRGFIHY